MDSIELELDAQFFDADVIARTAYRYSGDFYVSVRSAVPSHVVTLKPRTPDVDTADLAARFQTGLLRHYPTLSDIEAIAQHEEELWQHTQSFFRTPYLTSKIDPDWFRDYPQGPHRL